MTERQTARLTYSGGLVLSCYEVDSAETSAIGDLIVNYADEDGTQHGLMVSRDHWLDFDLTRVTDA